MSYGHGGFGDNFKPKTAELVNGRCPNCTNDVIFISFCKDFFRCTVCGADLEQKINGKISYIPAVFSKDNIRFGLANESKKI